jgi:Mn2+/Fe2+ NRAMP family transporter
MLLLLRRRLLLPIIALFSILGPAFITANVDNDAPGIATYSVAGAHYGYTMLWLLWPTLVVLIVVQEICARMGVATGKGLADLIREEFGVKVTAALMVCLLATNLMNTAGEFAGLASGARIFGLPPYVSVPAGALIIWLLVLRGTYRGVERIFLVACLVYLAYPISGFLARPEWGFVLKRSCEPGLPLNLPALTMAMGIVGTTVAPWMQFYLQAAVVDKGTKPAEYGYAKWDVIIGGIFAIIVVFFITVACAATMHPKGIRIADAAQAAEALRPLAGDYARTLFAIGLLNAALFAACILPLSTAYSICEGVGWERGVDQSFRAAPQFYVLYTGLIVVGAALVLWPGAPLLRIMLLSQVMNGILLPVVLVLMLRLAARRGLMQQLTMSRPYLLFCWVIAALLIVLDLLLLAATFLPAAL